MELAPKDWQFFPNPEQQARVAILDELINRVMVATGRPPRVILAAPAFFFGINPRERCGVKIVFTNLPLDTILAHA